MKKLKTVSSDANIKCTYVQASYVKIVQTETIPMESRISPAWVEGTGSRKEGRCVSSPLLRVGMVGK